VKRAMVAALAAALLVPPAALAAAPDAAVTGTWFDGLDAGICFDDALEASGDFDYTIAALIVPCDGPHDNEVVARLPLGDGDFPTRDMGVFADEACAPEHEAFLGRPIESTLMRPFNVGPDADDWAAGAHDALCITYADEPVRGTAASGTLRYLGETLAVYREIEQKPDVWLVDAGTGEALRNVTDNDLRQLLQSPAWTPNGLALAVSAQTGDEGDQSDIHLVSVADGASVSLVEGPASEEGADFSPDGSTMVYFSDIDGGEFEIYTLDLARGETTRLTTYEDRDSTPRWSPDGTQIAFRRRTDGVSDIWLMDLDGSDLRRLTDNGGSSYDPRWSPDGTRIAFTTDQAGNFDIGVMNADGSEQQLLTTHPADDEYPSWSSDGQILAFHSTRHGGISLWLMQADGTGQSEPTGLAPMGFPVFAPVLIE